MKLPEPPGTCPPPFRIMLLRRPSGGAAAYSSGFSPAARCPVAGQWYSYSADGAAGLRIDSVAQRKPPFPLFPEQKPRQPRSSA